MIFAQKINGILLHGCVYRSCRNRKLFARYIVVYQYIFSRFRICYMHIKKKISQTIDDGFVLISSNILYDMRVVSDNDVCSTIDKLLC